MTELFNYDTSWLNPALKLLIAAVYILVAYAYIRARRLYDGDLRRVLTTLFWMANIAVLSAVIRYFGDGTQFGFTKEYSLKWFQSLGYIAQGILFVVAVRQVAGGIVPEIREEADDSKVASSGNTGKKGR